MDFLGAGHKFMNRFGASLNKGQLLGINHYVNISDDYFGGVEFKPVGICRLNRELLLR